MRTTPARLLAATCLVVTAVLSGVTVLLEPEFSTDSVQRLAAMDAAGTTGTLSLLAFVIAQLPFMVAAVAMALLARPGAPRLAVTGAVLAVVGGFGHAVVGGVNLVYLAMAGDVANRDAMAEVMTTTESGPAVLFMACGMLGTVLGLVLLGVALFRSRVVARWIPVALWAFLVMEFVVSNLSAWATPAAGLLYLAAFGAVAREIVVGRTPTRDAADPVGTLPTPS